MNTLDTELSSINSQVHAADVLITAIGWGLSELSDWAKMAPATGHAQRVADIADEIETLTLIQRSILRDAQAEITALNEATFPRAIRSVQAKAA